MNILIVDDEISQVNLLKGFLEKQGYGITTTTNPNEAVDIAYNQHIDIVISDFNMPDIKGDELLSILKSINPEIKIIIITAYGTVEKAVSLIKSGAEDFIEKPIDLKELLEKISKLEESIITERGIRDIEEKVNIDIPFKNPKILNIYKNINKIADSDINVLITGESGVGKEVIAQTIHKLSQRSRRAFVAVNCAAIPENLFENEFFGHEKGAFTGAITTKKGKFELADGGTIFLDEVGEIPLNLQGKLLRGIQERVIQRVGGEKDIKIDVRIISATNKNLKDMTENNEFREDLYYRLNVVEINIPPLRERVEDIPIFIDYFIDKFSNKQVKISNDARDLLIKYEYPGNIRELENIIQRAVALCSGNIISLNEIPDNIKKRDSLKSISDVPSNLLNEVEILEKRRIIEALEKNNFNKSRAANSLGINERVIRYKIKKYKIL